MCGVAGLIDVRRETPAGRLEELVAAMTDRLAHRGPDDRGVWVHAPLGVALGHRRLSVLDLTPAAHQPMVLPRPGGRLALTYNGELFDHARLRERLTGDGFRGSGDTETLLHAIRAWGVEDAVRACRGMFAFGVVDTAARRLTLVRDRLGEKPLYIARSERWLAFASEVVAFGAVEGLLGGVEPAALAPFLATGAVPAPLSMHRNVRSLLPGEVVEIDLDRPCDVPAPGSRFFWRASDHLESRPVTDPEPWLDELDATIGEAVRLRLLSDVPLAAFLSGGIDSSLVVAHAIEAAGSLRTFTVAFPDAAGDETALARRIAHHLGTDHVEIPVGAADALAMVPRLVTIHSEPHADPSSIPTALLAEQVREHVTVALSGDGGDELFAGYARHAAAARWATSRVSGPLSGAVRAAGPVLQPLAGLAARRPGRTSHRLDNLLRVASANPAEAALAFSGRWKQPQRLVRAAAAPLVPTPLVPDAGSGVAAADPIATAAHLDLVTFLPDLVLVKSDRCSMAAGLEVRAPLLDHLVVEAALHTPSDWKVRDGVGKWALRRLVARRLPAEVVDAPKAGFEPPIASWLRGALRPWGEELLGQHEPLEGLLDLAPARAAWRAHQRGHDQAYRLWTVLCLLAWDAHRTGQAERSARTDRTHARSSAIVDAP